MCWSRRKKIKNSNFSNLNNNLRSPIKMLIHVLMLWQFQKKLNLHLLMELLAINSITIWLMLLNKTPLLVLKTGMLVKDHWFNILLMMKMFNSLMQLMRVLEKENLYLKWSWVSWNSEFYFFWCFIISQVKLYYYHIFILFYH